MKKYLLPLALMSALLVSCEKPENNEPEPEPEPEPEYAISISPAELTFGAEGGEQTVKVTSTYGEEGDLWWLETEEYCDWCEASLSSGENGEEVTFTVDSYDNTDETRTVAFTFYCGDKEADLLITQEAKVYSISVEPTELTFEVEGGEAEVTITSSDDWSISNQPDWIDVSERYGENGATIIVTAEYYYYNTEAAPRSGEIVFTCGNKEAKISITQKVDDSPIIRFKDPHFHEALLETYSVFWNDTEYYVNIDRNNDGQISEKEASLVEALDLIEAMRSASVTTIRNVDELSYFTRLKYLSMVSYSSEVVVSVESIDLSNLSQFEYLDVRNANLQSLDVSNNTALTYLYCYDNQLTSLDVSNNAALEYLGCSDNQLTSLDVSNNTALTSLSCDGNQLTSLDLSNNTALTYLYCYDNQLTSLDVSNNTALTSLSCYGNQLTSLDLSNNTALTYLYCYDNQLTSLDVSNNAALTSLSCYGNQLTSLDVSNNTALTYLSCDGNQLTSLDLHNNRLLETLSCSDNPLQELILYKYHIIKRMDSIEEEYGDIIKYME